MAKSSQPAATVRDADQSSTKSTSKWLATVLLVIVGTCCISLTSGQGSDFIDPMGPFPHNTPLQPLASLPPSSMRSNHDNAHSCYINGKAEGCKPLFVNAAFNRTVEVTNTCGLGGKRTPFCYQTSSHGYKFCDNWCDARDPRKRHTAEFLTDLNDNNSTQTWWQSETMFDGVDQVNLTLYLGKTFDITYVQLKFHSPRPESMAIYKKYNETSEWEPFQFYARSCQHQYNVQNIRDAMVSRLNETSALCSSRYTDITPITGGNVLFTTLDNRPSQEDLENNVALQDFIQASHIMIVLDRMNTFGDHLFGQSQVLQSYYYAISDIAVGGFCKCNGHASMCVPIDPSDPEKQLTCVCEHNTAGRSCERCLDFYNDLPWDKGTVSNAHECKACDCNGRSNRCQFDQDLWQRTGRGGRCLDCRDFTTGPHCEKCLENYYQNANGDCVACNCDPTGSITQQCKPNGQCNCKQGVEGQRCDRCEANYHTFPRNKDDDGCQFCACNVAGSYNNTASCDSFSGQCRCKLNVEGPKCDQCKPGFFDLQTDHEFGCLPCFCYGHSSVCESDNDYLKTNVESMFMRDSEGWTAMTRSGMEVPFNYNSMTKTIGVTSSGREDIFFIASDRYIGDQKASYNQFLSFTLRISEEGPRATFEDVSFEGAGLTISQPIFGQGNPLPSSSSQQYRFRLHEDSTLYGWTPRLNAKDFISVLANLTAIKIRATYTPQGTGFVDDVRLESAQNLPSAYGPKATWIEKCTCPQGYVGRFCESCDIGYRHNPPGGGSFVECVPCQCNGHATSCDTDTGKCFCEHHTAGDDCGKCDSGYYGNPVKVQNESACQPCMCPNDGPCTVLPDGNVACLDCPAGYAGYKCDLCIDGYFGDPSRGIGEDRLCQECHCNGNVDQNTLGNCDTTTGECLKCIFNTGGNKCQDCLPGFYGNATTLPKGQCRPCSCNHDGTKPSFGQVGRTYDTAFLCNGNDGKCSCKANVMGRQCDRCVDGYFNLTSGQGCQSCDCNPIGSVNRTCDTRTGQCYCREGVTGKKCDQCLPLHYGFSTKGCSLCECDPIGSSGLQCDLFTGQCACRPNVEGRRCERCRENKHNKAAGCEDCHVCYNLVLDAVKVHREKIANLSVLLDEIEKNPQIVEDANFEQQLDSVSIKVQTMLQEAVRAEGTDGSLVSQITELQSRIGRIRATGLEVKSRLGPIEQIVRQGEVNISATEELIDQAQQTLANARRVLESEGRSALEKARERSKKFGQQSLRMSEIARQARQLADQHDTEAGEIEKVALEAFNTSSEAHRLAYDAIQTQDNNRRELEKLQEKISSITNMMDMTQKMALEAKSTSKKAYEEALRHFTDVNSMSVPSLESDKLRMEAIDLIKQAEDILREADNLIQRNIEVLNSTNYDQRMARDLLNEAIRQQKITDELLVEAFAAYGKANQSIAAGEATLSEAQKTLNTLLEFDRLVSESRAKAEEAVKKMAAIQEQIDTAQSKVTQAENALQGALQDAQEARDVALEAQKIAEKASADADKIREEAGTTKLRASKLRGEADILTGSVEETGTRMKEFENQANSDESLAKDALSRVNQAKTSAFDADKKISDALGTIKSIMAALDDVQDIDPRILDDLERKLEQAEQELRNANLDSRLATLKTARDQQKGWMNNYDEEITKLQKDVDNILEIKNAIPQRCYRRVRLEP
ncbi:Laminin subunit gamma-1 [Halotydeus destructor]|nr:Laminin subunit gamma-1 [Halotydeus destructor]